MGLSLSLQGIGAQLQSEEEYTKIVELITGGPAERGNELQAGDRIIGIGQGVDGDIQEVIGMRLDDVVSQIRGEKGTVVRLNVIPVDAVSEASTTVVSITRETIKLEDQSAKKEVIELTYNGDDYKIGVIDLPTFYFDFEAAARGEEDFLGRRGADLIDQDFQALHLVTESQLRRRNSKAGIVGGNAQIAAHSDAQAAADAKAVDLGY